VRNAAAQLGVSPATVAAAYRLLQDRGVVAADGRRGTRVRPAPPIAIPREVAHALPACAISPTAIPTPPCSPMVTPRCARSDPSRGLYGEELNDPRLLELAREQFRADGLPAEHVSVVSGALDGIERVLREHLRPGDRVAVEDPSFTGILDLLNALSLVPVAVAVDDQGLLPVPT
jgi:DNA-binding transcriptional MocR family regulator